MPLIDGIILVLAALGVVKWMGEWQAAQDSQAEEEDE